MQRADGPLACVRFINFMLVVIAGGKPRFCPFLHTRDLDPSQSCRHLNFVFHQEFRTHTQLNTTAYRHLCPTDVVVDPVADCIRGVSYSTIQYNTPHPAARAEGGGQTFFPGASRQFFTVTGGNEVQGSLVPKLQGAFVRSSFFQ